MTNLHRVQSTQAITIVTISLKACHFCSASPPLEVRHYLSVSLPLEARHYCNVTGVSLLLEVPTTAVTFYL